MEGGAEGICICTEEHKIKYEYHVEQKQISLFAQGKVVICMMNNMNNYFIKHFCLNFTYKLLVVAKLHLDLEFVHFHPQADSPNNAPLPQTFLHPQKAQHNPQNLEIYRFQCNQNQPTFHVLTFYFNKFHITHAYQFIYKYMYIYMYTGVKK